MSLSLRALTLACLALASSATARDILVVDQAGGPGFDFLELDAAVASAQNGDVLIVREGDYGGWILIDGKGLSLVGEAGAEVLVQDVDIRNLAAGQTASLTNLKIRSTGNTGSDTVLSLGIRDCAGAVWLQDCTVRTRTVGLVAVGGPAEVIDCDQVGFARCTLSGELDPGGFAFFFGGPGLFVQNSTVTIHQSDLLGTTGVAGTTGPGPAGLEVASSTVFLSDSILRGGQGAAGASQLGFCTNGAEGGPGLLLGEGDPQVRTQDVTLVPGAGGPGGVGVPGPFCAAGPDGVESTVTSGSVLPVAAGPRSLHVTTPVREGETLTSTYTGVEGDLIFGFWSLNAGVSPIFAELGGSFLPAIPVTTLTYHGLAPLGGEVALTVQVQELGVPGVTIYVQALFGNVSEGLVLSNGTQTVLLDGSL